MKLDRFKRKDTERFEYIETQLQWGDGLTAAELGETFEISRQAAQKVITDYRTHFPNQLFYDEKRKRHKPTETFESVLIRENPIYFLDYLRGKSLVKYYREDIEWSDLDVTDIDRLLRPDLPVFPIQVVLKALLHHQVVSIDYRKKDLGEGEPTERSISPNHLVYADNRYHLRAYCHRRNVYLDFVLTRILHAEIMEEQDWVSSDGDSDWNGFIDLYFVPNPDLPENVRASILRSYEDLKTGKRKIRCRKALAFYLERKLLSMNEKYGMALWKKA